MAPGNDEAVSPVVGVILMVAITVVLAAVVYVLVSRNDANQDRPKFALTVDELTDQLRVVSSDREADWNRLAIRASSAGSEFSLNGDIMTTIAVGTTNVELTASADDMFAGEYLQFCSTAGMDGRSFTIIDTTANTRLGSYTFHSLATCT